MSHSVRMNGTLNTNAALSLLAALIATTLTACGAPGDDASGSVDEGTAELREAFPAFKPDIGVLSQNMANPVLAHAKLVTITYPTDTNRARLEAFSDGLGKSRFWKETVSEYGVGPTASDASLHVHLGTADLPAEEHGKLFDQDLVTFITTHARAGTAGFPVADAETLYVLYVPKEVKLTTGDGSVGACDSYMGYHDESVVDGKHLLYTIVYEACGNGTLDEVTDTASHEIAEAATDPYVSDAATLALSGFDAEHLAFSLFNPRQEENGDACEFFDEANVTLGGDFPFHVQSLWSNRSARAGHNPCVPTDPDGAATQAYYNVTPLDMGGIDVTISQRGKKTSTVAAVRTKGFRVDPRTNEVSFKVGFYSDKKTASAWKLSAVEGPVWSQSHEHRLAITFGADHATTTEGRDGTTAVVHVSFDPKKTAALTGDGVLVTLVSELSGIKHYMPVLIAVPR